ncbi:hypothetical protein JXQ70_12965 [bacterium]|nr:hypothetical protein [bacterium]
MTELNLSKTRLWTCPRTLTIPAVWALLVFISVICSVPENLLAASGPADDAILESPAERVAWSDNSPRLVDGHISTVASASDTAPLVLVGTSMGCIYRYEWATRGWDKVKSLTIPDEIMQRFKESDFSFLQKFSGISEKELEAITAEPQDEIPEIKIDLSEISYEDLTFEDIELSAVDISDIEFREDFESDEEYESEGEADNDPEDRDISTIEEEDIETIHITDESYLRHPQEVYARLAREKGQRQQSTPEWSQRELERVLSRYSQSFVSITCLVIPPGPAAPCFALTPLALYRSRDRGRSWHELMISQWKQGEHFRWLTVSSRSGQLVLLSDKTIRSTEDYGISWQESPLPADMADYHRIMLPGGLPPQYLVMADDAISVSGLTAGPAVVQPVTRVLSLEGPCGNFLSGDAVEHRVVIGCEQGLFLSESSGQAWRHVQPAGMPEAAVHQVLLFRDKPSWVLALVQGTPYFSTDTGQTFQALSGPGSTLDLVGLAISPDIEDGYLFIGVSTRQCFFLGVSASGIPQVQAGWSQSSLEPGGTLSWPHRLSSYQQLLGQARWNCLWYSSEFEHFRARSRLAHYLPRFNFSFSFYSIEYDQVRHYQNIDFRDSPDRYVLGPLEVISTHDQSEYYLISFNLSWDLGQVLHPDTPSISQKMASTFTRMKKQEKRLRHLYEQQNSLDRQLKDTDGSDPGRLLDILLKAWEIEALLFPYNHRIDEQTR